MRALALLVLAGCASASYRDRVEADGPIVYLDFEGSVEARGGVTFEAGPIGRAGRFDGSTGRVRVANGLRPIGAGAFTIELWFCAESAERGDLINCKAEEGRNDLGVFSCLHGPDSVTHYEAQDFRASADEVEVGRWHHVAVVREAGGAIVLYVDGVERDRGEGELSLDYDADLLIGSNHQAEDVDAITFPFKGWIDEVAVYAKALPRERIESHFHAVRLDLAKEPVPPPPATAEEGFTPLFNGVDLTGFKAVLERKGNAFKVEEGVLVCRGSPAGYLMTERRFRNFTLRYDWRFERPVTLENDADFHGNSGCLLFIADAGVLGIWPQSVEVQGMHRDAGMILPIPRSLKVKFEDFPAVRSKALKPVGQWNAMEIVVKDGGGEVRLNGQKVSSFSGCELVEGPLGWQSEGAVIHWRNIRVREDR